MIGDPRRVESARGMPRTIVFCAEALSHVVRGSGMTVNVEDQNRRIIDVKFRHGPREECDGALDQCEDDNERGHAYRPPLPGLVFSGKSKRCDNYQHGCEQRCNGLRVGKKCQRIECARKWRSNDVREREFESDADGLRVCRRILNGRNATG